MVFLFMLVFVSAFLCYLTKKRWQRKQKIFLFEEKKHLLKKSPSTNLPIDQPFLLEVVFRATSAVQALSVPSLNLLKKTSVLKNECLYFAIAFSFKLSPTIRNDFLTINLYVVRHGVRSQRM